MQVESQHLRDMLGEIRKAQLNDVVLTPRG
jgi:hypothetical protein